MVQLVGFCEVSMIRINTKCNDVLFKGKNMQRYNRDLRRVLITVVLIAALLASAILVAAIFSEPQPTIDDGFPESEHVSNLPTASLTVIIDSGSQGTRLVGNLEFGFLNHSTGYTLGVIGDWLQIRNGANKTDAIGLGYTEQRVYDFAYLGETRVFDNWTNRTVSSSSSTDGIAWSPNEKSSTHVGDIREDDITELTMAGFVVEYEDFRVYFNDGSEIVCGPTNITMGVNFTLIDNEWKVEYIFEASSTDDVSFGPDSVTIQLTEEIPEADDDSITFDQPASEVRMVVLPIMAIPILTGLVILVVIVLTSKRQ
jgi:hypothetical protein